MAGYNWLQKKIAFELLNGSYTIQELSQRLGENPLEIENAVKQLTEIKVVNENQGKLSLSSEVIKEFQERQETREKEKPKIDLTAFIEVTGVNEKKVSAQLKKIADSLKSNPLLTVYSLETSEPEKEKDTFTGHIEITLGAKSFNSLINFMYLFSPTAIEIIRPSKAEFTAHDLQEGLNEMADFIFKYNNYIGKNLQKTELNEFYSKLFQEKTK